MEGQENGDRDSVIWDFLTLPTPTSHAEIVRAEREAWRWRKMWFWAVSGALAAAVVPTVWFGGDWAWGGVAYEVTAAAGFVFVVEGKLQAYMGFSKPAAFYRWVAGVWYVALLGAFISALFREGVLGQ